MVQKSPNPTIESPGEDDCQESEEPPGQQRLVGIEGMKHEREDVDKD